MEYLKTADPYVTLFLSSALKICSFLRGSVGTTIRKQEYFVQRKTILAALRQVVKAALIV